MTLPAVQPYLPFFPESPDVNTTPRLPWTAWALLAAVAGSTMSPGQQVVESRQLLMAGLGVVDDIEALPGGEILASLPAQGIVTRINLATQTTSVFCTGVIHGMALEPGGAALWVADFGLGTLRRVSLATGQTLETISGMAHPIEILWTSPSTMIVGTQLQPSFFTSPGELRTVTLHPPQPPQVTTLATGIVGGMDVELNEDGRVFVTSLGSNTLDEVLLPGGQIVPVAGPVIQGADLLRGPENAVIASTLLLGEILSISTSPPVAVTPMAVLVGGIGPGCEDMAYDGEGQIIVAMNNGEIWRVRVRGEVIQQGFSWSGYPFNVLMSLPGNAGDGYGLAASFGLAPVSLPVPGLSQSWLLAFDSLFATTVVPGNPLIANGFGVLDALGQATASVSVPVLPAGWVVDLYFGAMIFQGPTPVHVPDVLHVVIRS